MRLRIRTVAKGGKKGNFHGIGAALPGDVRNPNGAIEVIAPALRYKFNAKPGEVRNPYGRRGYKGSGIEKMVERKRSPESERLALEHKELTEICRMEARPAIEALRDIINSETAADSAKIQAIGILMDRAYGKATQTNVNAQVNADGKPTEIDDRELNNRIEAAIKRIEAVTARAPTEVGGEEQPTDLRKLN